MEAVKTRDQQRKDRKSKHSHILLQTITRQGFKISSPTFAHPGSHIYIYNTGASVFLIVLPPSSLKEPPQLDPTSLVCDATSWASAGSSSDTSVPADFSPGSRSFSPASSYLGSVWFYYKNQLPTPGSLNSLQFSPPCPYLCCLSLFSPVEYLRISKTDVCNLLTTLHSQSNVHSQPLGFLVYVLLL